jgi:hypothetical protein
MILSSRTPSRCQGLLVGEFGLMNVALQVIQNVQRNTLVSRNFYGQSFVLALLFPPSSKSQLIGVR